MNQINPNFTSCIYNLLYIQYNEIFGREEYFYYDLAYPVFYNVKNGYFQVDKQILDNLMMMLMNYLVKESVGALSFLLINIIYLKQKFYKLITAPK